MWYDGFMRGVLGTTCVWLFLIWSLTSLRSEGQDPTLGPLNLQRFSNAASTILQETNRGPQCGEEQACVRYHGSATAETFRVSARETCRVWRHLPLQGRDTSWR